MAPTAIGTLAVAIVGCGSHVDTTLPEIPHSTVLLNDEIQSNVDDSWGRYVILISNDSISGHALSQQIREVLEKDGWSTRSVRHPAGSIDAVKSGETDISFGPAISNMRYFVPPEVNSAVPTQRQAQRRAVFVAIR